MWFKFKNVATIINETFHLLLITILLGNPFNTKQIDDIIVMASVTKTNLTTIMTNSGTPKQQQQHHSLQQHQHNHIHQQQHKIANKTTNITSVAASVTLLPAPTMATIPSTSILVSSLDAPLFGLEASDVNKLYNSTLFQTFERNDSSKIDTLKDDSDKHEEGLSGIHMISKYIALSANSVQQQKATTTTTTKLLVPTMQPTTKLSKQISTTRKLLSLSSLSPPSLSSVLMPDDQARLDLNRTYLKDLTSLSLSSSSSSSSLNNTTALITRELESFSSTLFAFTSISTASSLIASTSIFPSHDETATALRHQETEQTMNSTNSYLTVDNVNATIMSTNRATISAKRQNQLHFKDTTTKLSLQKNTSAIAKGSSNDKTINSTSSNSSSSSSNSESFNNSSNRSISEPVTVAGNSSRLTNIGTTRISARKVDSKYIFSKAHKTDAPMLNYIFDTFSSANKHHHHDQRYGPHFEDVQLVGTPTNMTVQAGSSIYLNCRISLLQDKTVSWVRRNAQGENALDLLTVGLHTYTGDKRYKMEFQYPSNWRLKINNVKKDDEATYECQISTHPPRVIQINLHVNAPKVMIVDEFGDPLQEKYYEQESTLQLSCMVRNVAMSSSVVFWKHSDDILNYDVTRGGISVKTELMDDGANSTLFIAKINKADSGNYTCSISEYQNYTIVVHILNGESFAELHHGTALSWQKLNHRFWITNIVLAIILLSLLPAYTNR